MEKYTFITAIAHFGMYFGLSVLFLLIFKMAYTWVTPHKEWQLIKEGKNTAAAIGFGGAVVGFALALASAASHSVSLLDFASWAGVALLAQLFSFFIVQMLFMPKIAKRIEEGELSAGIVLAATNIAIGLLNAACMTY